MGGCLYAWGGGAGKGGKVVPLPYKCVKFHGFVALYLPSDLFGCITFKLILDCKHEGSHSEGCFLTFSLTYTLLESLFIG